MKAALVLLLVSVALVNAAITPSWRPCPGKTEMANVTAVTFTPDPPTFNNNNTIVVSIAGTTVTTSGKYTLTVYMGTIPILNKQGNICETLSVPLPLNMGSVTLISTGCPIAAVQQTTIFMVLGNPVSGKFISKVDAYNQDNAALFCSELTLQS
jgi:hypothetical protein